MIKKLEIPRLSINVSKLNRLILKYCLIFPSPLTLSKNYNILFRKHYANFFIKLKALITYEI